MKPKIGDLVEPTKRLQSFGYDTYGIIIGKRGGRFEVYFPAINYTAIFHPSHLVFTPSELKPVKK